MVTMMMVVMVMVREMLITITMVWKVMFAMVMMVMMVMMSMMSMMMMLMMTLITIEQDSSHIAGRFSCSKSSISKPKCKKIHAYAVFQYLSTSASNEIHWKSMYQMQNIFAAYVAITYSISVLQYFNVKCNTLK